MLDANRIETTIEQALRYKLQNYNPEPAHMPFHTRLLGTGRLALYSFIHSLSTNFGTAIFEKVAMALAHGRFEEVSSQRMVGDKITTDADRAIQEIMNGLTSGATNPNHKSEIGLIRRNAQSGTATTRRLRKADIYLANQNEKIILDLKTAKPNLTGFESYKRQLLEWAATTLYQSPEADVRTIIAIPYNPYYPGPYNRWTMKGMLEIENQSQLMVGDELWDFLAGETVYNDLLDCFERVGKRMKPEIDARFDKFN